MAGEAQDTKVDVAAITKSVTEQLEAKFKPQFEQLAELKTNVGILGDTLKPVSLRPIAALTNLQDLSIRGTWKHPETISGLTK